MTVPSPMSANRTGFTTRSLGLAWKHLAERGGAHGVESGRGGLEKVIDGPQASEAWFMRRARCHCNRAERGTRRKNIIVFEAVAD